MTTAKKLMTADELLAMPDDGRHYELLDGELVEMPPTGGMHGRTEVRVAVRLTTYADQYGGEVWGGEPGFFLRRNPDRVRAPDVCYFTQGRAPTGVARQGYCDIIPDLIVEVISPGDTANKVLAKIEEWLAAGARLVWAVYPDRRIVMAYHKLTDIRVYTEGDILDAEPVLPGFACPVAQFFQ